MIGENDFFVWDQSYSIYVPIFDSKHDITLALNTTLKKKWGHRKDVWLSYFGNSFNIRGWDIPELKKNNLLSDSYRFGHEYIFSSVEIRKLIIPKHHSRLGLFNGLSVVGFFDGGFIFHTWSKIKDEKLMGGAGIGIRIPIPLLESLRVDLGWGLREKKCRTGLLLNFFSLNPQPKSTRSDSNSGIGILIPIPAPPINFSSFILDHV
jgi:hypothetical protein